METVTDFIFLDSKIIADGNYSHEIKRCLLLGRKAMANLDYVLKSRDITLLTKFHTAKAMVFPVVMYRCESWSVRKSERWRMDAFKLWCWRGLLRATWTARRSNQSVLKEISAEYSLDWCWSWSSNMLPPDAKNWLRGKDPVILCHPLLLLPLIFPSIRVFSNESSLRIRWPKYWSFSLNISPSNEHPGLISFRMDWLDLLTVQGPLKSLLQHHGSKASIL